MYSPTLLALLPTILSLPSPNAQPEPQVGPLRIPLQHHNLRQYSDDLATRSDWLKDQAAGMRAKYASHLGKRGQDLLRRDMLEKEIRRNAKSKRASSSVQLTDVGIDASYSASVSIGTPAQSFLCILDTGSADLWVASTACQSSSCSGTTLFASSSSTTFQNIGTEFDISYGSGDAAGTLAKDTVELGGFTITGQTFGVVNETTSQLITAPLSGLMGLAWETIAQSGASPFWQTLASSGSWTDPEMGFYLARFRGDSTAQQVETSGGEFTMGGVDTSMISGSVNYISIPTSNQDYWRIQIQDVNVQGKSIDVLSSSSQPYCAIDTGTTLIGAPSSIVEAIYAQIPGSQAMSQSSGYAGYFQYPCSTVVNITLQFGGLSYSMSNADFNLGSFTRDASMCTGAFFEMDISSQSPIQWVVGASFLKNVYSVFRYNPSAVGFAALAGSVNSVSNGTSPSTTGGGTGGNSTSGSGSGSGSGSSGGAGRGATVTLAGVTVAVLGAIGAGAL